jgi:hypothetical protein
MVVRIVPRGTSELRCAYCHDDAGADVRACRACATILHEECWSLARACPSLGCAPRWAIVVRLVPEFRGATLWHLGAWLVVLSLVWLFLVRAVPEFAKFHEETGIQMNGASEAIVALATFCRTLFGIFVAANVFAASIAVFQRARARAALRLAYVLLTLLGIAFFPFAFVVFASNAMFGGIQKL